MPSSRTRILEFGGLVVGGNVGTKGAHVHTRYFHTSIVNPQKEENGSRSQIENEKKFFCFLLALPTTDRSSEEMQLASIRRLHNRTCWQYSLEMARVAYILVEKKYRFVLIMLVFLLSRSVASFSRRTIYLGGRCRHRRALQPLFAVARPSDPAVLSPLFGRHMSSDSFKKTFTASKELSLKKQSNVTLMDSSADKNATTDATTADSNDEHKDSLHGALHQVEHRAKEKGGIELSRLAAEEAIKIIERSAQRGRAIEHAAELGLERVTERLGERTAERLGERAAERIGERSAERIGERAAERIGERSAERIGERAAERIGERAAERIGERSAERIGERSAERIGERAAERIGERALERAAEIGERVGEHSVIAGRRGLKEVARPLALTIPERVALRIGRGVLIALPALGGVFALYLLKMDKTRAATERKNGARLPSLLFGGAAVTDAVDAVFHFAIAYGVFHEFSHHVLAQLEEASLACAFISTFCAVMGEILAYRRRKKQSLARKADAIESSQSS